MRSNRFTHIGIFLRRLAHDRGRINRIFTVRDAAHVKYGIEIFQRIKASVVAERDLRCEVRRDERGLRE